MTMNKISFTQTQGVTLSIPAQGRILTHTPRRDITEESVHLKVELDFYTIKWLTVSHRSPESSAFSHKGTLPYLPPLRSQTCFSTIQHQNSMRPPLSPPLTALKIGHYLSCTTFWVEHPATTPDSPTRVFLIDFFMKFIMQNVLYHLDSHLTCCTEIYVYILLI